MIETLIGLNRNSTLGVLLDQLIDESATLQKVLREARHSAENGNWEPVRALLNETLNVYGERPL